MNTRLGVGITCVGSGVGQSVISSLRCSRLPIKTIGLGTNPFAFGAFDCDAMDSVPSIYDAEYVPALIEACRKHDIRLIIPGLDDEALILSEQIQILCAAGIDAVVAGSPLIQLCRDKEQMSRELNPAASVFVRGYDHNSIQGALERGEVAFPLIAKPRGGFASRGILILLESEHLKEVTPDHIIQEMAVPLPEDPNFSQYMRQIEKRVNPQLSEISIQIVSGADGRQLGRMASYNRLQNGVPIEVIPYNSELVWQVIDRLMPEFDKRGLRGPLNLQGRITTTGLRIFEMNPRFTGITGLRALLGFNEVEACVRSWLGLGGPGPRLRLHSGKFGVRQTTDKAVPINRSTPVEHLHKRLHPGYLSSRRSIVLVTGSTGFLGRNIVRAIVSAHEVWTLDRDKQRARDLFKGLGEVMFFDHADLAYGNLPLGRVDHLLHLAFARPHRPKDEMATSLLFTQELVTRAVQHHVPAIVNISSQTVYGSRRSPLWTESLFAAPETMYAQAKWSCELMVRAATSLNRQTCGTSIRLATVSGGDADTSDSGDVLARLVRQALAGELLNVVGGENQMTRLDVRDAIGGIGALLDLDPLSWRCVYNLDATERLSVEEMAQEVSRMVAKAGFPKVEVRRRNETFNKRFGMDCSALQEDTGWRPEFRLTDTIESLIHYCRT